MAEASEEWVITSAINVESRVLRFSSRAQLTTAMTSLLSPFRQTYRYLVRNYFISAQNHADKNYAHKQQRQAHESPVIFYSVVLGTIGPVMVVAVPPIREYFGYRPAEIVPNTYPRAYPYFTCGRLLTDHFSSQPTADNCTRIRRRVINLLGTGF
jgi:hypothetical protein